MKFYTLRLFQRAPTAPARGQWSTAVNLQFCPHCQALNDKNGTACTRCNQPLVAFTPGPASLSTALVGPPHPNAPADVDDRMAQTVLRQDAAGEVPRRQPFSAKLAMIMSAAALGVALFSVFSTGRFQLTSGRPTDHAAGGSEPSPQAGTGPLGNGVDAATRLPAAEAVPVAPAPPLGVAGIPEYDTGRGAMPAPEPRPPLSPVPVDSTSVAGRDSEPRLLIPDAEEAGPRGAAALAPDPVSPPTALRARSEGAPVSGPARPAPLLAPSGIASAVPSDNVPTDDAAPTGPQAAKQLAMPPTAGCTDAIKTLGLCATPKN